MKKNDPSDPLGIYHSNRIFGTPPFSREEDDKMRREALAMDQAHADAEFEDRVRDIIAACARAS
jgi:hypothetical protein